MAVFVLIMFFLMIAFGGIAVDVMRFETRRVAMQQTLDRAALAAANLDQTEAADVIAAEWFEKTGLGEDLAMVTFSDPDITAISDAGLRRVTMNATVRSRNFFMGLLNVDYLESPTRAEAAQGVSQIEVMLVLDITGSMGESLGGGQTKIQGLRSAATEFINIVETNDTLNGVSIGMVPYAANVNIPVALRNQFSVTNISSWNGVENAGVPNINCVEIPTGTFTSVGLSTSLSMRMMAVADTNSGTTATTEYLAASANGPSASARACTTRPNDPGTPYNDELVNLLMMPSKDTAPLVTAISRLYAQGNTSIAVGMRWATALIDDDARPIYTAIGDSTVQGRPADNSSVETRKIIILMTDGAHVTNNHVKDAYKSGASPIWLGTDGNYAIRFWSGGSDLNDNTKPSNCSGWTISSGREYFVPHLKDKQERKKVGALEPEGLGTGSYVTGACDPNAWFAAPTWPKTVADGSDPDDERDVVTVPDGPDADLLPDVVMITATRLDWSEVWRYLKVSYVARQFYMRSDVSGTTDYNTIMNLMRQTYLSSAGTMDSLLQQNCTAAKAAGIEIYGIAFAAPASGQTQINGCASEPKVNYYYNAADNTALLAAFQSIATDISELRLTQ